MSSSDEVVSSEDDCRECIRCAQYRKKIKELESKLNKNNYTKEENSQSETDEGILNLSESRIEELIDKYYTYELFLQGQKGVISFIYSYIVRDDTDQSKILYKCIDQSKKIFGFHDDEGFHKDVRCKTMLDAVYDPLIKKVNKIYRTSINKIYEEEKNNNQDDIDEYDSDIEEVIATELHFNNENISSIDDRVNDMVNRFLEIKKCCKNRKPIIDELSQMLYI